MSWVRIDDGFAEHPKVLKLSDAAFRLHVHALCYVSRTLTNGAIPREWLTGGKSRKLPKVVSELVDSRVWDAQGDGFVIHDYLAYQPSREDVETRRRKRADAGKLGGQRSGEARRQAKTKQSASSLLEAKTNDLRTPSPKSLLKAANTVRVEDIQFRHPRFVIRKDWHEKRVDGLSDGEFGMSKFYKHLAEYVDAHPDEDTEPHFEWLQGHFDAFLKRRKRPAASASDVPGVEETRRRLLSTR